MELLTEERVREILAEQRKFFAGGKTMSLSFRKENLLRLKNAILAHQAQLEEALSKDLGKSRQESYSSEIGFVLSEITHTLRHLAK